MSSSVKKCETISQGDTVAAPTCDTVFLAPRVPVVFRGTGPYLVEGPHTDEVYYFSPRKAEQLIDARDAAALVKTDLFKRKDAGEQITGLSSAAQRPPAPAPQPLTGDEPLES